MSLEYVAAHVVQRPTSSFSLGPKEGYEIVMFLYFVNVHPNRKIFYTVKMGVLSVG